MSPVVSEGKGRSSLANDPALRPAAGSEGWTPDEGQNSGDARQFNEEKYISVTNKFIKLFISQKFDSAFEMFSSDLKNFYSRPGCSSLAEYHRLLLLRRGKLLRLGEPEFGRLGAAFPLFAERGEWTIQLTLNAKGEITRFLFLEPEQAIPVPDRNWTPMRLPFRGEWTVSMGGPTEHENYHAGIDLPSQKRAIDWFVAGDQGRAYQTDASRNEDYYCYGKEILAPADGTVVVAIDGVPDNRPGSVNTSSGIGNALIIKHDLFEFSALYHLQLHSLVVKDGANVKAGQVIARCGNSGNSHSPHLHFHVMNTDILKEATGFPPYFRNVRLRREGGSRVEEIQDYSPVRGDRLEQID